MGLFDMIGDSSGYTVGDAISNYTGGDGLSNLNTNWLGNTTSDIGSTGGGFSFGNLPIGKITNALGKLGAGLGSGIATYQAGRQANYIPYTRWLGNGLAMTGMINNMQNKQNLMDQSFGAGQMLGNFPGNFFGLFKNRNNSNTNLNTLPTTSTDIFNPNLDDIYGNNYGTISRAITDRVRS